MQLILYNIKHIIINTFFYLKLKMILFITKYKQKNTKLTSYNTYYTTSFSSIKFKTSK